MTVGQRVVPVGFLPVVDQRSAGVYGGMVLDTNGRKAFFCPLLRVLGRTGEEKRFTAGACLSHVGTESLVQRLGSATFLQPGTQTKFLDLIDRDIQYT